jgi:transposase
MGRNISDVARSLGVNPNLLRKWKVAGSQSPSSGEDSGELESLRRYIRQLEMEREILKKALSIFSRTT